MEDGDEFAPGVVTSIIHMHALLSKCFRGWFFFSNQKKQTEEKVVTSTRKSYTILSMRTTKIFRYQTIFLVG